MNEIEIGKDKNFIEDEIDKDFASGRYVGKLYTRFPPEPNGYLHIGHAKAICINFGLKEKYNGMCNLRFDDTNPEKESDEYVQAIKRDIEWLGFSWDKLLFASDYFEQMYEYALLLIKKGKAYVCDLSAEDTKKYRGTLTQPGIDSPFRERSIEENMDLFVRMKDGEFEDGARVLRAKIDMASPNMNLRDPIIYRIMRAHHQNTGDKWCIYPMYDYAHPLEDAIEGITHSLCSLEFEDHRPLYEWVMRETEIKNPPRQIEFARLNMTRTIMSKRYLKKLVDENYVSGWDDPRMPTLSGLRRRGYTPESIREFCSLIGVAKANSLVEASMLDHCLREDIKLKSKRVMAVLRPVKLIIDNYEDGKTEMLDIENNQEALEMGMRQVSFSKEIYIENTDFMIDPPKKFFRLSPGREVRLKNAYIIKCESYETDENGDVTVIHCTYDKDSKSGQEGANRKVKGTLHWVNANDCADATIRLYDYLLKEEATKDDFEKMLNEESTVVLSNCKVEKGLLEHVPEDKFQFLRQGYFCIDKDSTKENLVFNRIVDLKDTWAKISKE